MLTFTTGTAFIMWLGEQITDRGIGNGMSLIIFVGIVVGLPGAIGNIYTNTFVTHQWNPLQMVIILAVMVAVVAFIVLVERGERRIPVQYAKRVVGRRMMGGQSTHLPLKVNAGGVIPIIFASSLLALPQTAIQANFVKNSPWLSNMFGALGSSTPLYYLVYVLLIVFFCFFYVSIIFNPNEAADNMRKYGGFIPGYPARQKHCRIHGQDPVEDHGGGWSLPFNSVADPDDHDLRESSCSGCLWSGTSSMLISRAGFWTDSASRSSSAELRS